MPKKVTYFHLPTCPYCKQADRVIEELIKEHPEYAAVEFERINEMKQPEIADARIPPCLSGRKRSTSPTSLKKRMSAGGMWRKCSAGRWKTEKQGKQVC